MDKSFQKVDSFSTSEVVAAFPTKLGAGQYWGKIKIYKGNEVVNSYEIAFTVAKKGELPQGAPDLGIWPWLLLAGYILSLIIVIFILIKIKIWRLIIKLLILIGLIILKPFRPAGRKLAAAFENIKKKFWRWMSKKASKYDKDE